MPHPWSVAPGRGHLRHGLPALACTVPAWWSSKASWRQERLHGRLVVNTCRIRFKGSSSMSSHFTTTPASDRPGLPKPLPSLAHASRMKRSQSLQNVNATFTPDATSHWRRHCSSATAERAPPARHPGARDCSELHHGYRRTYSGASRSSVCRGSLPFPRYLNLSPSSQP